MSVGLLTVTKGGRVRGCVGVVGIIVHYTLLYISGGIWGPFYNCWFNGPIPQCSGLYWLFYIVCTSILWG